MNETMHFVLKRAGLIYIAILYVFLVSKSSWGENSEYLIAQPHAEPYFVKENDTDVVLPCVFVPKYVQAPFRFNWVRDVGSGGPQILTSESTNFISDVYDLDSTSCNGCYNLRIKLVKYNLHNGRFSCQVNGPSGVNVISRPAVVIVLVKPGPPVLSAQPAILHEGKLGRLECRSSGGNPPPKITWFFSNGTEVTSLARQSNALDLSQPTISHLQWTVSANEDGSRVTCKAWNQALILNESLEVVSSPVVVYYAPRVSAGPVSPLNVELGSYASLYCGAVSNPPPTKFMWLFNNVMLDNYSPNFTIPFVTKNMTGIYTCQVTNDEGTGRDSINFNVLYAPEISSPTEYHSAVGSSVRLTCGVDANPAPTSVTWSSPNGRTSDGNVLEIHSLSQKDFGNYTCTAKNLLNLYAAGSVYRTASKSALLIIDHPPGKGVIRANEPVIVGQTANLTCSADIPGNPPAQFKWKSPGQQDFEPIFRNSFTINDIQLSHAGLYSCLPWNVIGSGEIGTFQLIVYDPARINGFLSSEDTKTEADLGYQLNCSAVGYPLPNITWYKDSELITADDHWEIHQESRDTQCSSASHCLLQVVGILKWKDGIKWTDKGEIACGAYNGAGQIAFSRMNLRIFHKPVIVNDPNRPFVASNVGGPAEILCRASSKPEPSFSWSKGDVGDLGSDPAYAVSLQKNESNDLYESVFRIRNLREGDMGDYVCKATNNFGSSTFIFTIQAKTKPLIPENLRSLKQSHRWILLSWTPGFNGGSRQTFDVEVIYADDQPFQTFSVSENDADARYKRHAKIETALSVYLNISSGILPNSEYKFRVRAKNDLGLTEWSQYASVWSADAPLNLSVKKVTYAVYNADSLTLEFQPNNLETQLYCLLIYRKENNLNGKFVTYSCVDPAPKVEGVPSAASLKVRFCYRFTLECGESYDVLISASRAGLGWEVIVAVISSICVLAALFLVGCFVFRRCRPFSADKTKKSSAVNGFRKDYEMESNQARPKTISGPFLTEKTPGPGSGLGSLDQNTASSKDSGVFTNASNYHYDPSPYVDHDTRQFFSSNGLHSNNNVNRGTADRRPSYGDQKNWDADYTANPYQYINNYRNPTNVRDIRDGGDVNRGFDGEFYDPSSGAGSYPADPFDGAVEMNPDPTMGGPGAEHRPNGLHDSSLNSEFSTPSQKRVIREIIV